jgi:hypothetical protein
MYQAIVTPVQAILPHPNADKLEIAVVANHSLTQQQKELAELIHMKKQQARANKSLEELEAEYNALTAAK